MNSPINFKFFNDFLLIPNHPFCNSLIIRSNKIPRFQKQIAIARVIADNKLLRNQLYNCCTNYGYNNLILSN